MLTKLKPDRLFAKEAEAAGTRYLSYDWD